MTTSSGAAGRVPAALPYSLESWGWDAQLAGALGSQPVGGLWPARVIAQHRGMWRVTGEQGETNATPTGRFRHAAEDGGMPAVGDWVACVYSPHDGEPLVEAVLPRRSAFRRRAAGRRPGAQIVAANVDTLLLATSLNGDLNPSRLERYVAMARESGAEPVVLLTKADLVDGAIDSAARVQAELRVPAVAISSRTVEGLDAASRWLEPRKTVALVGSSGVGKSTLLNRLAGQELMVTQEIREDDARGRHTTTHRELFLLASGALVLDTPGMREFGVWDADEGVDETFAEIVELSDRCRFADCSHKFEPGCEVRAAVADGRLDAGRLNSYKRLAHELADRRPATQRRERARRFQKAVANSAAESMARKVYRDWD